MVCAASDSRSVALRIVWIVCAVMLRFLAPAAAPLSTVSDAPPPPAEDRLAAADGASAGDADDPSDVDDGDDDPDDAALPAAIAADVPRAVVQPPAWRLLPLTDKDSRDPLFRPPRAA